MFPSINFSRGVLRMLVALAMSGLMTGSAGAIDGSNNVALTVPAEVNTGWKTFEILSGNDALGGRAKEGFVWTSKHSIWDGLGAYRHDVATLRVFINHEVGPNSTFSRVDLDLGNLRSWMANGIANNTISNQVAAPGTIVTEVSPGWLTVGSGSSPINRPCSGNVWRADTFGPGRGFADTLYLTGEETFDTSGQFWVMDVATRTVYECPSLGGGSWENGTIIDTGRTDTVALFLAEDAGGGASGTAPLRLYVGQKNPAGNFLERNGLSGGSVYYWDPVGESTNGTLAGLFAGGNGVTVSGTWVTGSTDAALFSKLEDVHTNMELASSTYGVEAAFASQHVAVFTVEFGQLDFVAGGLGVNRDSTVLVLFEQGSQAMANGFRAMDNLVWTGDGCIYVNEDDGEGDVWKIDVNSLKASYALSDFTPDATQVFDILDANVVTETSGIIDISEHVGYAPGGVFLTVGQSDTLADNQLILLVAPGAVSLAGYELWLAGYPSLRWGDMLSTADPDRDGVVNMKEFAFNLNPAIPDHAVLVAGSGTSGLPLVEIRNASGGARLVVEYVRRLGSGDLVSTPLFGMDLTDPGSWSTGGVETVTPIDSSFERVVREDGVLIGTTISRFALVRLVFSAP